MENEVGDIPPGDSPPPDFQMPSVDQILKALEGMDISEQDKEELRRNLLARAEGLEGIKPELVAQQAQQSSGAIAPEFAILLTMITVLALIFVFFGYKLYKSLVDRERRREEKRRQKQQKKKK